MSQQPGWYDDPQDIEVLRYWDGVQWTSHTSPRQRPNLDQTRNAWMDDQRSYGGSSGESAPGAYGSATGYQPMPGGQFEAADGATRTPDGQQISGWWRRFFARIFDGLIIGLLSLLLIPLVAPDLMDTFRAYLDVVTDPSTAEAGADAALGNVISATAPFALASALLSVVYEIVFLRFKSGTPGKLILGLRVRLREEHGELPWSTSGIRALVWFGPQFLGTIPLLGQIASIFPLINGLWPLWDAQKQSLNDKVAKTNVVRKG